VREDVKVKTKAHIALVAAIVVLVAPVGAIADETSCPPGTRVDPSGGMHGNRAECVVVEDGYFGSGWRLTYEPGDGGHAAAFRSRYEGQASGHHHHSGCNPTPEQQAFADWLVGESRRVLEDRYLNDPGQVLADGFVAYPIPSSKWFHMIHPQRFEDGDYVPSADPTRGDPRSRVFNPKYIESFMYGMTDEGLTPFGAMYALPKSYKGWDQADLPNPTGCLLQWHNHTEAEGFASSFDPENPDQSTWMSHVWTYGGLDPWGRDYDGTEPHAWFMGYRYLPTLCNDEGGCI
jgi:hypothetical protein